jgi:hypothetical protein
LELLLLLVFTKTALQIETFFKALKQNLKIKTFVGTSQNALFIQIWTALITILLLKYLQFQSTRAWSLSTLFALLHYNLFTYQDLWTWINHPSQGSSDCSKCNGDSYSFSITWIASKKKKEESGFEMIHEPVLNDYVIRSGFMISDYFGQQ